LRDQQQSKTAYFLNSEKSPSGEALSSLIKESQQRPQKNNSNSKASEQQSLRPKLQNQRFGGNSGGGGDAVLLESGKIVLLDFYETLDRYNFNPVTPSGSNLDEKVESLLVRLSKTDFVRAQLYRNWYRSFFLETGLLANKKAANLADEGGAFICTNCEVFQMVIQKDIDPPISPFRYYIVEGVWNQLSLDQQAYTVIHELLLRELRESGPRRTTEEIRYFNALLISDSLKNLSSEEYRQLLVRFGFLFQTNKWGYLDIIRHNFDAEKLIADFDFGTYQVGPFQIPVFYSYVNFEGVRFAWGREVWTECQKDDCFTYVLNRSAQYAHTQLANDFKVFKDKGFHISGFVVKHIAGDTTGWSEILILGDFLKNDSGDSALYALSRLGTFQLHQLQPWDEDLPFLPDYMKYTSQENSKAKLLDNAIYSFQNRFAGFQMTLNRAKQRLTLTTCQGNRPQGADFLNFFLGLNEGDPLRPCSGPGMFVELTSTGVSFQKIISQYAENHTGYRSQNYFLKFSMESIVVTNTRHEDWGNLEIQTGNPYENIQGSYRYHPSENSEDFKSVPFNIECDGTKNILLSFRYGYHPFLVSCTLAKDSKIPVTVNVKQGLFGLGGTSVELQLKTFKRGQLINFRKNGLN
jgi:hypothetical protein